MKTILTRFGEVSYRPENILRFPGGLIGFESLRDFVVVPNEKEGPLYWIQSIEDAHVAFILTDPSSFYPEYKVVPDGGEREKLEIDNDGDCLVVSVVTVASDKKITLNLAAPILFAPETNRALQVILERTNFSTQTPLPSCEHPSTAV